MLPLINRYLVILASILPFAPLSTLIPINVVHPIIYPRNGLNGEWRRKRKAAGKAGRGESGFNR